MNEPDELTLIRHQRDELAAQIAVMEAEANRMNKITSALWNVLARNERMFNLAMQETAPFAFSPLLPR